MKRLLWWLFALLVLPGCEWSEAFRLSNNSNESISICFKYYNDAVERDTLMPKESVDIDGNMTVLCKPNTFHYITVRDFMDKYYYLGRNDNNRLDVFIISTDTLKKYGYDEVRRNNRALVRYRFTRVQSEYLCKKRGGDNLVCYPPTEAMVDYGIDVFVYPEVKVSNQERMR